MRFLSFPIVMLSLMFFSFGCEKTKSVQMEDTVPLEQIRAEAEHAEPQEPNTAVMYVYGMGCPQCAYNVDLQLLKLKGVSDIKVDMASGKVTAKLSPENPPTEAQLTKAIKNTGFTLVKIQMPAS